MPKSFLLRATLSLSLVLGWTSACGSNKDQCQDSDCAPNNVCVAENGDTKCRRLCSSQFDPATGCPFNFTCVTRAQGDYCSQNALVLNKVDKGQWGAPCNPARGRDANVDCDIDQEFRCYGESPSDANSYCTRFDCTDDRQCGAGMYCATVNRYPDVTSAIRSIKSTTRVCLKRAYCAPCASDVDCPSDGGKISHCIADAAMGHYCTVECDSDMACNNEAKCTNTPDAPKKVCVQRAGVCIGDGSICAPCRSDKDCPRGLCEKTEYSTERWCTVQSGVPCTQARPDGDCPLMVNGAAKAGCFTSNEPQWQNQCTGFFTLGQPPDQDTVAGCYTPAR
jgi:hypothetical protein